MNGGVRTLALMLAAFAPVSCLGKVVKDIGETADDLVNQVTTSLDQAINAIDAQSNNWQTILQELTATLPDEVQSTVTNEVSNLMQRGIAATGTELRCSTDFFANRMKQGLLSIKIVFLGGEPLPVEPQLCQVVPLAVDMNLEPARRNKIELYGYDFDQEQISVVLATAGGGETDVTTFLDQPTHYHLTLNLGATGVQLPADATRLVLRWSGRNISTIGILQPTAAVCRSRVVDVPIPTMGLLPPKTRGDAEFDGNGPTLYGSVTLVNQLDRVDALLFLRARETESDWSTAEGELVQTVFRADPGWMVDTLVSPQFAEFAYTDSNHSTDEFAGGGPVQTWFFKGDKDGDDIGGYTGMEVAFNNLRVQVKENRDCVASETMRAMRPEFVAPDTRARLLVPE